MAINQITPFPTVEMPKLGKYRSHLTEIPCDRMRPQDRLEAEALTVLLQNTSAGETNQLPADF